MRLAGKSGRENPESITQTKSFRMARTSIPILERRMKRYEALTGTASWCKTGRVQTLALQLHHS
jgi:hypothetical protein